jgi:hypothetical protein
VQQLEESTTMSEHKGDELSATGSHRVQRNWLDRAHVTLPPSQPANPRHAAITRSLNSWSNYKSWTDKVRSNWDKDKGGK